MEYTFDGSKILFYFTADGRVDFRELVKDLASVFKTRIELRQVGVRDEAKMLGGLGICGLPFCCSTFLDDFQPVSIKMAKEQSLSLNPTKISGTCGRLMCCLKYEQEAYEDLLSTTPKVSSLVETPLGLGTVIDVSLMSGKLKVRLEDGPDLTPKSFHKSEVTVRRGPQKGGRPPREAPKEIQEAKEGGEEQGNQQPREKREARPLKGRDSKPERKPDGEAGSRPPRPPKPPRQKKPAEQQVRDAAKREQAGEKGKRQPENHEPNQPPREGGAPRKRSRPRRRRPSGGGPGHNNSQPPRADKSD